MKTFAKLNKEKSRLLAVFLVFVTLTVSAGFYSYHAKKQENLANAEAILKSIADLKIRQIVDWRQERLDDANLLAHRPFFNEFFAESLKRKLNAQEQKKMLHTLMNAKQIYCFENISVLDPKGNIVFIADSSEYSHLIADSKVKALEVMKSKKAVFQNFYLCPEHNIPLLEVTSPLLVMKGDSETAVGSFIITIDPQQFLYPLIQEWPVPSKTSETLIVEQQGDSVVYLNDLRHRKNTALKLKSPLKKQYLPAAAAVRGFRGIMQGIDYRGNKVLAFTHPVPNSNWFMVAKTDLSEVHAPMKAFLFNLGLIVFVIIAFGATLIAFIYSMQKRSYFRSLYEAEKDKQKSAKIIAEQFILIKAVFESSDQPIFSVDTDYRYTGFNKAHAALMKALYNADIEVGKSILDYQTIDIDRTTSKKNLDRALAGERFVESAYSGEETRSLRYFEILHNPIFDNDKVAGASVFVTDITARKQAEEEVIRSRKLLKDIIDNSPSLIYLFDADGRFLLINRNLETLFAMTSEQLLGETREKCLPPEFAQLHRNNDLEIIKTKKTITFEEENLEPDGRHVYLSTKFPLIDEKGNIFAVGGISTDITARKLAEEKLAASEIRYRRLFESAKDGILIIDADSGKIIDANPFLSQLLGFSLDNFLGKRIWELGFFKDIVANKDNFDELLKHGYIRYEDLPLETAGGKRIDVEFVSNVYIVDTQKIIQCNIRDITARKKAEQSLRESEEKFRAIFENNSAAIAIIEPDTTISMVNDAYCQISGYSREEVTGMSWTKQIPPGDLERLKDYNRKRLLNPQDAPEKYEFTFYRRNGEIRHALMSVSMIQSSKKIISSFVDINDRIRAEKALNELSERQQALLDSVPDIIMEVDNNKTYTWANRPGLEFFGEDVIGKEANSYFEGIQETYNIVQPIFNGSSSDIIYVESWQRRKDGEIRLLAWWCKMLKDEHGNVTGALSTARDITENKKAEQALRESEEKFRLAFDTSPDAICITKAADGAFLNLNLGFCKISGYSREELLQSNSLELNIYADPEDRRKIVETLKTKGLVINYEALFRRKDNTTFTGLMSAVVLTIDKTPCILSITSDIEEIKQAQAEREKILTELEHMNHELETLVFIASHDLRSPLINVLGFSKNLEKDFNDLIEQVKFGDYPVIVKDKLENLFKTKVFTALHYITASGLKMDALINGLLKLSRTGRIPLNLREIDMNELMKRVIDSSAYQIANAGAEITIGNLPKCIGDFNQISQVLSNLVDNAVKYSAPGRKPVIKISGEIVDSHSRYAIEDNGVGIEKKNLNRIWELFSRINESGEVSGEGLGLALARRIVERQRGKICAESEFGKGSRFILELPTA